MSVPPRRRREPKGPGVPKTPPKEARVALYTPENYDFIVQAGRRWRQNQRMIPRFLAWMWACLVFSLFCLVSILLMVFLRPAPDLYLTYPDGSLRCAPITVRVDTGAEVPKRRGLVPECVRLDYKFGVGKEE